MSTQSSSLIRNIGSRQTRFPEVSLKDYSDNCSTRGGIIGLLNTFYQIIKYALDEGPTHNQFISIAHCL